MRGSSVPGFESWASPWLRLGDSRNFLASVELSHKREAIAISQGLFRIVRGLRKVLE